MLMGLSGFRNVKCKCWFYIKGEEQWPKKESPYLKILMN